MGRTEMCNIDKERLKEVILSRGMTQPKLAKKIGVAYQALNRGINEGRLSAVKLKAICSLLDCDEEYIKGNAVLDFGFNQHNKPQRFNNLEDFEAAIKEMDPEEDGNIQFMLARDSSGKIETQVRCREYVPIDRLLDELLDALIYEGKDDRILDALKRHGIME